MKQEFPIFWAVIALAILSLPLSDQGPIHVGPCNPEMQTCI